MFQRKARINLRAATAGSDLEALELAQEKFTKSKLSETDEDYRRASRRLKYLKLKKGKIQKVFQLHNTRHYNKEKPLVVIN